MSEILGYIFRISTEQWVDHVFDMAIYFTNLRRKLESGHTILFIHKTSAGDALVGYGVVDHVAEKNELSEEEQLECEKGQWKRAIEFKYVKRFENPLLIKETFFRDSRVRGRLFHGLELTSKQLDSILRQAEASWYYQKS